MRVKLCSFLYFCHVAVASGALLPTKNIFLNEFKYSIRNTNSNDYNSELQNNDYQRNNEIQREVPIFSIETTSIGKSHEEPKTEEPSFTDTYEAVTESNPARQCPEDQSYISEKDLNEMIIYFAKVNLLRETINGSYFEFATSVRDKHLKTTHEFLTRFYNKPTHLSHILDDMVQIRIEQIEPLVKAVNSKIPEINALQIKNTEFINNSKILLEIFEKSKKICALNCDATETRSRRKRNIDNPVGPLPSNHSTSAEVYYCGTLKDAKNKINVALSQFKNEYIETLHNTLIEVNSNYTKNIEILKSMMKKAAVQEFGTTMYDILNLEDEYYHFLNLVKGENGLNNFESQINKIRKNNMLIDYKTAELKNHVEKYRKYCLSCDIKHRRYRRESSQNLLALTELANDVSPTELTNDVSVTKTTSEMSPTEPTNDVSPTEPTKDVIEELLSNIIDGIKTKAQTDLDNLFQELNDILTDKDKIIQEALVNLRPIQNQIMNDMKNEEQKLNALKKQVPDLLLEHLKKISEDSTNMQNKMEEALKFIQHTIQI